MKDIIATFESNATKPDGKEIKIIANIGTPYDAGENWACPVSIDPMFGRLGDACGEDSFQALSMAVSMVLYQLEAFQAKGGKIEYPLEALSFRFGDEK